MADYTLRADGTAANLAAALNGDPAVVSECLSISGYNSYSSGASPGDNFQFADTGGRYYGAQLSCYASGTSGSPITHEAYSGDSPYITNAILVSGWTVSSGSIWQATLTTEPEQVWMDDTFGDRKTGTGSMVNEYDWYWASNVLYIYAATDPDTRYTSPGVEADQDNRCINTNDRDWLVFDGLTWGKAQGWSFFIRQSSNVTVKNCVGEWAWRAGLAVWSWSGSDSNVTVEDCTFRYCGENGLHALVGASGYYSSIVFRRNTCYENGLYQWADPLWEPDSVHGYTSGIKLWSDDIQCAGIEVYENRCYSNGPPQAITGSQKGNGIWPDHMSGTSESHLQVTRNLCYSNRGSGLFTEISSNIDFHNNILYDNALGQVGIDNPYAAGGIKVQCRVNYHANNNRVYNNTIYDCPIGIQAVTYGEGASLEYNNNTFKNNICVGCDVALRVSGGAANDGTYGTGNVYERNCLGAESAAFIKWDGVDCDTYNEFISESSQTDNNIEGDPLLTDAASGDFTLTGASPCIGAAEDLGAPFDVALMPGTQAEDWTDSVVTGSQDDY